MRLGFKDYSEYLEMPAKTFEAWENGAEIIAQGRYESGRSPVLLTFCERMETHMS